MKLHRKSNKKDYRRCYVNFKLNKNTSTSENSPDAILRNVQLTPTLINHILNAIKKDKTPELDVALFVREEPHNDLVVTLSVPYFPNNPPTTLEERFL